MKVKNFDEKNIKKFKEKNASFISFIQGYINVIKLGQLQQRQKKILDECQEKKLYT